MKTEERYLDGAYLARRPDWHRQDAGWKAALVAELLGEVALAPNSICDVGCGSGDVLAQLKSRMPHIRMCGYDVSPQAAEQWHRHDGREIAFVLGDFNNENQMPHDVVLMLDVFEHVRDPFTFLECAKRHGRHFVFHIPLDLSASSVLRGWPLLNVREQVGHLHYYTKDLALATLADAGFGVVSWRYTGASLSSPGRSLKTRLAGLPRRLAYAIHKDIGVRLLGGETLLVLATPGGD